MTQTLLAFSWTRWVAEAAVSGLWQGLVLASVAWAALRLIPRTSAAIRFLVWTGVLLGALILPFIHGTSLASSVTPTRTVRLSMPWSLSIAGLWAAISLMRLVQLLEQGFRLRRLWQQARVIPDLSPQLKSALDALAFRKVELCITDSESVDRPSVIGFLAPKILVPEWLLLQLSPAELEQIVLHEIEHLRRGDDWLNLVQKLCLAVSPLNPALFWIERKLCKERELACDDGVLRVTSAPTVYARCLTTLAEKSLERRSFGLASLALGVLGAFARESELSRRVYGILYRKPTLSPMVSRAFASLVMLGLFGAGTELARSPELIAFAGPNEATGTVASLDVEPRGMDRVLNAPINPYRDVVFPTNSHLGGPRMTLLKAVMPNSPKASGEVRPHKSSSLLRSTLQSKPHAKARETEQAAVPTNRASTEDSSIGIPAHAPSPSSPGSTALPVVARTSGSDNPNNAQPNAGWVILTSFEWHQNGQSVDFVRTTRITRAAQPGDGLQAMPATAQQTSNSAATPNPAQSPVAAHPVFLRYAAVPTDMGWLFVQL